MPLAPALLDEKVLAPIRRVLEPIARSFPGQPVATSEIRERIIVLADLALLGEFPQARALPAGLRRRLIAQVLDSPSAEAPEASTAAFTTILAPQSIAAAESMTLAVAEEAAGSLDVATPADSVQGFILDGESSDLPPVIAAVRSALGEGWEVKPVEGTRASFRATNCAIMLGVREAWNLAHQLSDEPAIATAEPVIEWMPAPPEAGGPAAAVAPMLTASFGGAPAVPACAEAAEWSVDQTRARQAWKFSEDAARPSQGDGVKIAHLDTGITFHTELPAQSVLLAEGANFYDPQRTGNAPLDPMDAGPIDVLKTWFIPLNGHGTGTLSVLLSAPGAQNGSVVAGGSKFVTGTAPKAKVVPIRVSPTVVHWNLDRMIKGINHAVNAGCHVITMSMGGPPPDGNALRDVVQRAVENGIIFCSAAGNIIGASDLFPAVVWPAALDNVIAVGGGNCAGRNWNGSSRGPEVNISGPAENVWHATARKGALKPTDPPGSESHPGNGTSFATPMVAGLAACWLAHHGRDALIQRYGHPRYIPRAFAYLLRTVAFNTPPGWKRKTLGPGIIDGGKLLAAPLPTKEAIKDFPKKGHSLFSYLLAGFFNAIHLVSPDDAAPATASSPALNLDSIGYDDPGMVLARKFGGEMRYLAFDRPMLFASVISHLSAARVEAAATRQTIPVKPPDQIIAALQAVASPRLARALRNESPSL